MWNFKREAYKVLNSLTQAIVCNATVSSGGMGITEYIIALDNPTGGIVIMDFDAQGVPDKLEIIHNGYLFS